MALRAQAFVLVAMVFAHGVARADDRPWAAGVSEKDQKKALKLYGEGNKLVEDARCKEAIERFTRALESWDYPGIHYNTALCLIKLDKPVEALAHLELSLRFADAPLGADLYRQALDHKKQLEGQLAVVEVRCEEAAAKVTLDGAPLLECPGKASRYVLPGPHQLVRTKPRFETETKPLTLTAGRTEMVVLPRMKTASRRLERRWSAWKPYAVIGTGVALGLAGVVPYLSARTDIDAYEQYLTDHCRPMTRCSAATDPVHAELEEANTRAETRSRIAVTMWAVGGALAATGTVLVFLNQPRLVAVTPTVGTDRSAGLTISGRF